MQQKFSDTIFGLPITGLMGTNPAVTVSTVMGLAGLAFTVLVGQGVIQPPTPELQGVFDEYGDDAAGAAVLVWFLINGWLTRNSVISPKTGDKLRKQVVVPVK